MRQRDVLLRLHLSGGGEAGRAVIREVVDALDAPTWQAMRDRARADGIARDRVDDAIAWCVWRIAGPTLASDLDDTDEAVADIIDARARIVLGQLREVAESYSVTQREITAWAASQIPTLATWILRDAGIEEVATEHVEVARWLARAVRDPKRCDAVRARRSVAGVEGSILSRIDELWPCDLVSDSISEVLEATTRRLIREAWDGPDELAPPAAWEAQLPDGVERLRHFGSLHAEGAEMRHCVGLDSEYAQGIVDGRHEILSIRIGDERATAQIRRGRVVQCVTHGNAAPPQHLRALAERAARIVGER